MPHPTFPTQPLRIRAGMLVSQANRLYPGGCLVVNAGGVLAIEASPAGRVDLELPEWVIIPPLINSHTHLEFSGLVEPLSQTQGFTGWIENVIRYRRERMSDLLEESAAVSRLNNQTEVRHSLRFDDIRKGLAESIAGGAATITDIATDPFDTEIAEQFFSTSSSSTQKSASEIIPAPLVAVTDWQHSGGKVAGLKLLAFGEVLGWGSERQKDVKRWYLDLQKTWTEAAHHPASKVRALEVGGGISPHAPYSTSPHLIQWCIEQSRKQHIPLAMHLAETEEELEWLEARTGPFANVLEKLGIPPIPKLSQWQSLMDYLQQLARAERALVVHGNYLAQEHWDYLASRREHMSVVYCPRTHRYFGHRTYPLKKMMESGVRVVLGTDSRASNPDLNLWNELLFVASTFQDIPPETWLNLVTEEAAWSLGLGNFSGKLVPGSAPIWNMLRLNKGGPIPETGRFWESLFSPGDYTTPLLVTIPGRS